MSENNKDLMKEVVITQEDLQAALDFWSHFEIEVPTSLKEAYEAFSKSPTLENQEAVRLAITEAIIKSDHEAFKDEMFQPIVKQCEDINFEMQFDKELEKTVTTEE